MNNTQYSDEQIAAFTKAAEIMKERGMNYWPLRLLGLTDDYCLYSTEDDSIWLVDMNKSVSMFEAVKIQFILA